MDIHLVSNGRMELADFSKKAGQLAPFIDFIHIREKYRTAQEIIKATQLLIKENIPTDKIIINDRVDIAHAEGIGGVQLAYHSLESRTVREQFPRLRIGKSVHSVQEAQEAEAGGADYVLFGHIFSSTSKPGLEPRGVQALKNVVNEVALPVIAIGGITPQNVHEVRGAGAAGVAVMSGLLDAHDPIQTLKNYQKGWNA